MVVQRGFMVAMSVGTGAERSCRSVRQGYFDCESPLKIRQDLPRKKVVAPAQLRLQQVVYLRECSCFGNSAPCDHGVGKVTGSGFFLAPPPCPLHSPCRSARVFW
ncbi:unnamed protein product [Prunus brigantina]